MKGLDFITDAIGIENLDSWVQLDDIYQRVNFISDGILTFDPRYRLFYFDTTTEMMHVLNLEGELIPSTETETRNGYAKIIYNNKYYLNKILPNAIPYKLGEYNGIHISVSFDKIVGFFQNQKIPMSDIL